VSGFPCRPLAVACVRRFVARRLVRVDAATDTRDAEPSVAPGLPKIAAVWSDPLELDSGRGGVEVVTGV
jgi:hypothetical protein